MKFTLLILTLGLIPLSAHQVFTSPYILYSGGEIAVVVLDATTPYPVQDLCAAVAQARPDVLPLRCRLGDDWLRDTSALNYFQWLQRNAARSVEPELLRARDPLVALRLQAIQEQHVLVLAPRADTTWALLFHGESSEPAALHGFPGSPTPAALAKALFRRKVLPLPSPEQKAFERSQPDPYYTETPPFLGWIGTTTGLTQASFPLTPSSWYKTMRDSRIEQFRFVQDSSSAWYFLEDRALLTGLRAGGIWYGFIGVELFVQHSRHGVKYSRRDTAHTNIDQWYWDRYEVGMLGILTKTYPINAKWEWSPQALLGFQYSFARETFDLSGPVMETANLRLQLEPYYKGALAVGGLRLLWNHTLGLDVRTGINGRGRSVKSDPAMEAVQEETIVGAFTLDWFLAAGLQWTFQR